MNIADSTVYVVGLNHEVLLDYVYDSIEEAIPDINYHSHNMQKGTVVYSYNEFYTASPKKNGTKPYRWQLIKLDRNLKEIAKQR